MRFGYPLFLDVSDRLCVVVGGGKVAVRKVSGLLLAGAKRVCVVSPVVDPDMPVEVELIRQNYKTEHLSGAELVFAATSDASVNEAVVRDARAMRILVNRADGDEEYSGDFTVPAMVRKQELTVTVSAGGNPALAVRVRDDLSEAIDPRAVEMSAAMQMIRPMVLESKLPIDKRREIFRDLAGEAYLQMLVESGIQKLREEIARRILAGSGGGVA